MRRSGAIHSGKGGGGHLIGRILPVFFLMLILFCIIIYLAVSLKERIFSETITRHEKEQHIIALQQSSRLAEKIGHIESDLAILAAHPAITEQGEAEIRKLLRLFHDRHKEFATCASYMDNRSVLRYVEGGNRSAEGKYIGGQTHIRRLFERKGTVASGSFRAIEGYYAISIDAPVLEGGLVRGAIGTLVRCDAFSRWIDNGATKSDRASLILDPGGTAIHCDTEGYAGKHVSVIPFTARDEPPLPSNFFIAGNYGTARGSFFNDRKHNIACFPFYVGDQRYSFVSYIPSSDVAESLAESSRLLGLIVFSAFVVVMLGIAYISYLLLYDRRKSEVFRREIGMEIVERTQAEETLKESEERYRNLFHNMLDGVVVMETLYDEQNLPVRFICRDTNESFSRHSGKEPDFVMGRAVHDIHAGYESEEWLRICGSVALTGNPVRMEKYEPLFDCYLDFAIFKIDRRYLGLVFRNISDRTAAEKALGESEKKYRNILEDIAEAYFETDLAGNFTFFNDAVMKLSGFEKEELLGMNNREYTSPETSRLTLEVCKDILRTGSSRLLEDYEVIRKDGVRRMLEVSVSLLSDETGTPRGFRGVARDTTERREAVEALKASEAKYRSLASTADLMYLVDRECRFLFMNEEYRKRLGVDLDDVIGQPYANTHSSEGAAAFQDKVATIFRTGEPLFHEVRSRRDGKYFLRTLSPVKDGQNEITAMTVVSKDITERRLAEEKIEESLHEKEILLQEIHHRVKNNLQIVSSMLSLQSYQITDEKALCLFRESENRVRSMALIHEKLYHSDNLSRIQFDEYIKSLTESLLQMYRIDHIALVIDISRCIHFGLETAVPCGLIINELVSNALRHAFPGGREGRVLIRLRPGEESGTYELTVADDGIGYHDATGDKGFETLGMQLLHDLAHQLDGRVGFEVREGTVCTVVFRELHYKPRLFQ